MKYAAEQDGSPAIYIDSYDKVRNLIEDRKARRKTEHACIDEFYTVDPRLSETPFQSGPIKANENAKVLIDVLNRIENPKRTSNVMYPESRTVDSSLDEYERILSISRRFMLIAQTTQLVENTYVSVRKGA